MIDDLTNRTGGVPVRAAIYARYSSDNQRDESIEDQIRICEEFATRNGWTVVDCFSDRAISAASLIRPGIQRVMQRAATDFDVLITESLDRLSRDQEDVAGLYKRMCFFGVAIHSLAEGRINELHIGLKGTMGALFLKDLADKTRRGLRGRIEDGRSAGGLTFGYDVVRTDPEETGLRTINAEEARIVVRIFEAYAVGSSPRAIAQQLNQEGIAGPSGKGWGPSTIHGNPKRGTGIINNELYIGRAVWNRLRYIKDPATGKRVSRPNPPDQWIIREVPELRIVPQELWERVKAKQASLRLGPQPFWRRQRPRKLFSTLLQCSKCGGGFSMVSQTHYGCSNARNKGTCDNRRTIAKARLEAKALDALQHHLMDPALAAVFCEEYARHRNQLRAQHLADVAAYRKEMERLTREKDRMLDAVKNGFATPDMRDALDANWTRRQELEALLQDAPEAPPLIHPKMAERYRREVGNLIEALNDEARHAEAADLIRSLVDRIVLSPAADGGDLTIDVYGALAGILKIATNRGSVPVEESEALKQVKLVAGAGNQLNLHSGDSVSGDGPEVSELNRQDKLVAGACNPLCYNFGARMTPAFRDEVENAHQLAA